MNETDLDELGDASTLSPGAGTSVGGKRFRSADTCSYCGESGHRINRCQERRRVRLAERLLVVEERAKALGLTPTAK